MNKRRTLPLFVLVLFVFGFLPGFVQAKDEWLRVRSKNFNLVGNASEKDIRQVATKLEQFRETFRQLFTKTELNSPIPTNVVVFKNSAAYKPFKPKRADGKIDTFVAGYFQPGEDVNYITLSTEGDDAEIYGTIFHEYVHSILDINYGKSEVPTWFNEGLAEYYQTFAMEGDQKVKIGLPQSGHLQLLQQTKLVPLDTLFNISNYALHQNGNHSRSIFYAQSWALIHYLIQGGKAAGLNKFLSLLMQNTPAEKAFQEAFQTTYVAMEKDLRKYVGLNSYKYQLISFKDKLVVDAEMQVLPLSEADSNAYLGDLLYHTNRADDAEAYLLKALTIEPNLSMANTSYGMVKLRQRKYEEAKGYLEKAISKDSKNHLALYRYAYLLSREGRDEMGFVSSFPAQTAVRMREMLKNAIAIKPSFTESYELLAFINLVNNEHLDEAITYLRKALQYQPGNQRYAMRIAELYLRQEKFADAIAIAEKISKTADEDDIKAQAESLTGQIRQMQEMFANREKARRQYGEAQASGNGSDMPPALNRRSERASSPEEAAKAQEKAMMRSVNSQIRKKQSNETQIVGRIEKIECKGGVINYSIKTDSESFLLSSKDFQNLSLTALNADAENTQVGCGANMAALNAVLTYKPIANSKNASRGELTAIDFVPKNFYFMDPNEEIPTEVYITEEAPAPVKGEDFEAKRRAAMGQALKSALRVPQAGEKRELGFVEKIECSNKGMFIYFKTPSQAFKLTVTSPQTLQIRAFTPEVEQVQFGCGLKQLDIPVIFTFKEVANSKANAAGEVIMLEFVPKSFVLEK